MLLQKWCTHEECCIPVAGSISRSRSVAMQRTSNRMLTSCGELQQKTVSSVNKGKYLTVWHKINCKWSLRKSHIYLKSTAWEQFYKQINILIYHSISKTLCQKYKQQGDVRLLSEHCGQHCILQKTDPKYTEQSLHCKRIKSKCGNDRHKHIYTWALLLDSTLCCRS